jgi:hypothetical protein
MRTFKVFAALLLYLMIAGCATVQPIDPVQEFRRKHPEQADHFQHLAPIGLESYRMLTGAATGRVTGIAMTLKERFGDSEKIANYAQAILNREALLVKKRTEFFKELEQLLSAGGKLYEFIWSDGKTEETGLLVLQNGEIVKRESWLIDKAPQPN